MYLNKVKSIKLFAEIIVERSDDGRESKVQHSCAVGVIDVPINRIGGDFRCAADVICEHSAATIKRCTGLDIRVPSYSHDQSEVDQLRERVKSLEQLLASQAKDVAAVHQLRQLCGNIEDGSSKVVKLFQDDATATWHLEVYTPGYQNFSAAHYGSHLVEAISVGFNSTFGERHDFRD